MNEFVQRCLREWKRIGVPEGVANEMAADLDADLKDAAADDVSPEQVLGNGVFDPLSFARQWGAGRGVIPAPVVPSTPRGSRRTLAVVLAMLAALLELFFAIGHARTHATTSVAIVHKPMFVAPPQKFAPIPEGTVMEHDVPVGAPVAIAVAGVLLVVLLAGGAWFAWRGGRPAF